MENKIILGNVLTLVKGLCGTVFHATIESDELNFEKSLKEYLDIQKKIFQFMKDDGIYQLEKVEECKLEKAKNKFCCN